MSKRRLIIKGNDITNISIFYVEVILLMKKHEHIELVIEKKLKSLDICVFNL